MSDYKSNESSIHSSDVEQWLEDELREAGVNPDDIEIMTRRQKDMEISNNSTSLEKIDCEEKECIICHKGKMKPANPNAKTNYYFTCDNCGARLNITPNVIVE